MQYRVDYIGGPADRRSEIYKVPPSSPILVAEVVRTPRGPEDSITSIPCNYNKYLYRLRQVEEYVFVAILDGYKGPQW